MKVEFVHMRLYDLGAEVDPRAIRTLNGLQPKEAPVVAHSPIPPYSVFPKPLEVIFPWPEVEGGMVELRLHGLGALAVRVRWTAEAPAVSGLSVAAHDFPRGSATLEEAASGWLAKVRQEIAPALLSPYGTSVPPEHYLVYCIHAGKGEAAGFIQGNRDAIAALVSDEEEGSLVPARKEAAMRHLLQYGPDDAVVPGWDHAVILGTQGAYEDVLDVMELANLELLEFRTYDAYLDRRLEESFAALDRLWAPGGLFRSARSALQDISRVRVELARLTDNLHDTGKIFGDWYTAQLHQRLHARFHLASWESAVAAKMDALEDMFHLAQEEANHRRSVVLELMIILLFILDLFILVKAGG